MSTKIYNGFRIRNPTANELIQFINDLRTATKPYMYDAYNKSICQICRQIINQAVKTDINFDGSDKAIERTENMLKRWYIMSLNKKAIMNSVMTACYDYNEAISVLRLPLCEPILDIAVQLYAEDALNDTICLWDDLRSNMAFMNGDDTHTLFISFGNVFSKALRALAKNETLYEKYGLQEYDYWDNADKPDDILDEDWDHRKEMWTAAFADTFVPTDNGLCTVDIFDSNNLFSTYNMNVDGRTTKIYEMLGTIRDVIAVSAKQETIEHFTDNTKYYNPGWERLMRKENDCSKRLDNNDPEMIAYMNSIIDKRADLLKNKSISEILQQSIIDLMPNYKKFAKETNRIEL